MCMCFVVVYKSAFRFNERKERSVLFNDAFARGAMGRRIDPSWVGPIELFLVPASAPRPV